MLTVIGGGTLRAPAGSLKTRQRWEAPSSGSLPSAGPGPDQAAQEGSPKNRLQAVAVELGSRNWLKLFQLRRARFQRVGPWHAQKKIQEGLEEAIIPSPFPTITTRHPSKPATVRRGEGLQQP